MSICYKDGNVTNITQYHNVLKRGQCTAFGCGIDFCQKCCYEAGIRLTHGPYQFETKVQVKRINGSLSGLYAYFDCLLYSH